MKKGPCPERRGERLREGEQDKHQWRLVIEEADMRKVDDNFAFRCRGSCTRRGMLRGADEVSALACAPAARSSSRAPPTEASLAMITRPGLCPNFVKPKNEDFHFLALQNSGS